MSQQPLARRAGRPPRIFHPEVIVWVIAKASEAPIWQPGWETPRPAWSFGEIARNFNRSRTAARIGTTLDAGMVKRIVRAHGGPEARRYRRGRLAGGYPRIRKSFPFQIPGSRKRQPA